MLVSLFLRAAMKSIGIVQGFKILPAYIAEVTIPFKFIHAFLSLFTIQSFLGVIWLY